MSATAIIYEEFKCAGILLSVLCYHAIELLQLSLDVSAISITILSMETEEGQSYRTDPRFQPTFF